MIICRDMKNITLSIFALLIAIPLHGQGLTITLKETGPLGQTTSTLQTNRTNARLDIPSLASQVLYDSATRTLRLLVPLLRTYREFTPATPATPAAAVPITYRRAGSSKVQNWTCSVYEGYRGAEKVVEVCAAEGAAIALTSADFAIVQQAIDMAKAFTSPDMIERIPTYGSVAKQGYSGFAVRRVTFRNGQPELTAELAEIRRGEIPANTFSVPAGFTKAP
jgi:hypothetical protein